MGCRRLREDCDQGEGCGTREGGELLLLPPPSSSSLMLLDLFMITMISVPWRASWLVKIRGGFGGGGGEV